MQKRKMHHHRPKGIEERKAMSYVRWDHWFTNGNPESQFNKRADLGGNGGIDIAKKHEAM